MENSPKVWLERLRHGPDDARREAKLVLGGLTPADGDFVPELADALNRGDSEIRFWAVTALACIGPGARDAVPALIELLRDQVFGNRQAAVHALGRVGTAADPAVPSFLQTLKSDRNKYVRQEVVRALGGIGTPAAITALIETLEDRDPEVRRYAVISLKMLGSRAKVAIPALTQLMTRERDDDIRDQAAAALNLMGDG